MGERGATSSWTSVGGVRVHSRVAGPVDGRPLVLLPGLGMSHRTLGPLARALAADRRVWVVDTPGSGRSDRARDRPGVVDLAGVLRRWIRAQGLHAPTLIAVSLGCQVAVEAVRGEPDLVDGLVLISPPFGPQARGAARQAIGLARSARWERIGLVITIAADWLHTGLLRVLDLARTTARYPFEQAVAEVAVPVLILRGAHDPVAPSDWVRRLAAETGGRVRVIDGAGHGVHDAAPRRTAEVVREFLADRVERAGTEEA